MSTCYCLLPDRLEWAAPAAVPIPLPWGQVILGRGSGLPRNAKCSRRLVKLEVGLEVRLSVLTHHVHVHSLSHGTPDPDAVKYRAGEVLFLLPKDRITLTTGCVYTLLSSQASNGNHNNLCPLCLDPIPLHENKNCEHDDVDDDYEKLSRYSLTSCGHFFCEDCLRAHTVAQLDQRQLPIRCPFLHCAIPIRQKDVEVCLGATNYLLWIRLNEVFVKRSLLNSVSCCETLECNQMDQELQSMKCPSGCGTLLLSVPDSRALMCYSCLGTFCMFCHRRQTSARYHPEANRREAIKGQNYCNHSKSSSKSSSGSNGRGDLSSSTSTSSEFSNFSFNELPGCLSSYSSSSFSSYSWSSVSSTDMDDRVVSLKQNKCNHREVLKQDRHAQSSESTSSSVVHISSSSSSSSSGESRHHRHHDSSTSSSSGSSRNPNQRHNANRCSSSSSTSDDSRNHPKDDCIIS